MKFICPICDHNFVMHCDAANDHHFYIDNGDVDLTNFSFTIYPYSNTLFKGYDFSKYKRLYMRVKNNIYSSNIEDPPIAYLSINYGDPIKVPVFKYQDSLSILHKHINLISFL